MPISPSRWSSRQPIDILAAMRTRAKLLAVALLSICSLTAFADEPLTLDVWPGAVPGETGKVGAETKTESSWGGPTNPGKKTLIKIGNVTKPTLTVYRPAKDKDTGASVIICPGGGYSILAWDLEGTEVADWLNSIGVTGIVLKYRVPARQGQPRYLAPLMDAQRAVSLVRSKAGEWGLDPNRIGLLGFSAGGNLTAVACTNFDKRAYESVDTADQASCRPDFGILVYPAWLINDKTGEMMPEVKVTKESPPMFFAHAANDPIKADSSVQTYLALRRAGVPTELHVYAAGGHGFGLRPATQPAPTSWPQACAAWMKSRGLLEPMAGK
jgi:acetyl esterase/lipase